MKNQFLLAIALVINSANFAQTKHTYAANSSHAMSFSNASSSHTISHAKNLSNTANFSHTKSFSGTACSSKPTSHFAETSHSRMTGVSAAFEKTENTMQNVSTDHQIATQNKAAQITHQRILKKKKAETQIHEWHCPWCGKVVFQYNKPSVFFCSDRCVHHWIEIN
ncbi:MAG: hypothetical protein ACHQVK_02225 [Candidatus Paceibacterales bacterium]